MAKHPLENCLQFGYNSVTEKIPDKIENDAKIANRTNVCYERRKLMNKTEITQILDKLSDEKLDMFISFLRDILSNEPLPQSSHQEEKQAS